MKNAMVAIINTARNLWC